MKRKGKLILLSFCICILFSNVVWAQESIISSIKFKDTDIKIVLESIAEKAVKDGGKVNIVVGPGVTGPVSINLESVDWVTALDAIVKTYNYGYEWIGDTIILVDTFENLAEKRQKALEAKEIEALDTRVFILNFVKVEDVLDVLTNLLTSRGKITSNTNSNSIVITDIQSNLAKIEKTLSLLDIMTEQVLIEAKMIEISLGKTEKLGIDWNLKIAAAGSSRPTTFPFTDAIKGTGTKMFPRVSVPSDLEKITTTTTDSTGNVTTTTEEKTWHKLASGFPEASASNFLFGTLNFSQFQAVLEVLNSTSDTNIISNPKVLTLNNQKAEIFVGQTVPIPEYTFSKETGNQTISGYSDKKVGIGLIVTPTIQNKNYISLDINPKIEQIIGSTGPNGERPIYATRSVQTKVIIDNGQTLAIGGLISENKIKTKKKVPILGDIPLLGFFFSSKGDTLEKTDLLIFITAKIIR